MGVCRHLSNGEASGFAQVGEGARLGRELEVVQAGARVPGVLGDEPRQRFSRFRQGRPERCRWRSSAWITSGRGTFSLR